MGRTDESGQLVESFPRVGRPRAEAQVEPGELFAKVVSDPACTDAVESALELGQVEPVEAGVGVERRQGRGQARV